MLWLAYHQGEIFGKFEVSDKLIILVKNFGISRLMITFKISIANFLNKCPKRKKSSLSLYFLKNIFKIIKEICHENASESK